MIAYAWFLVSDWLGSPGKAIASLKTVMAANGMRCTPMASIQRNLPLVIVSFIWPLAELLFGLSHIDLSSAYPAFNVGLSATAVAIWFFELHMATSHPRGQRFGDRWATTQVMRR